MSHSPLFLARPHLDCCVHYTNEHNSRDEGVQEIEWNETSFYFTAFYIRIYYKNLSDKNLHLLASHAHMVTLLKCFVMAAGSQYKLSQSPHLKPFLKIYDLTVQS